MTFSIQRKKFDKALSSDKEKELIEMGQTPFVLREVGLKDKPLTKNIGIIRKAISADTEHNIPSVVIRNLPALLHDSLAIITVKDRFVVVINAADKSSRQAGSCYC